MVAADSVTGADERSTGWTDDGDTIVDSSTAAQARPTPANLHHLRRATTHRSGRLPTLEAVTQLPGPARDSLFDAALADLASFRWRTEVEIEEIPSPQRIAPFSAAIAADVSVEGTDVGNGRLVLLHDPAGNPAWDGTFRCVTFARAEVDLDMVTDPLLGEVAWSWLTDALAGHDAEYTAASGTVTAVSSRCFGGMQEEPDRAEVELRASWTMLLAEPHDFTAHIAAWQDLLCMTSGLPPLPEGVVPLDRSRRR